VIFVTLKPFEQRRDLPMDKILGDLRGKMFSCAKPSCSCSSRPRCRASAPAVA
jgi:hypothetical protein